MKKHFLLWDNPCQAIYTLVIILLVVGSINVFSASYISAYDMYGDGFYYLKRYLLFAVFGFGVMYLVRWVGYKRLLNPLLLWGVYIIVLGMLFAVDIIGMHVKGASRWLFIGPFSIQPSEAAKLVVIMLSANYLGSMLRKGIPVRLYNGRGFIVVMATMSYGVLVYKQPDLGTAAIIVGLMLGVFIIGGISRLAMLFIGCLSAVGIVLTTVLSPYRLERVKVWFDPWLDEQNTGYQMVQSLMAIGSGGLTGTSWGQGAGKFFYLPEPHTDFAFAIFCQENGFIGVLALLLVFGVLGMAFFSIAFSTRDRKGFLLAGGISFLIIGQAVANMAMVCGIFPVIGVPLVFISYGGSSMLISMTAIGLLLSVYDEERRLQELEAVPPEARRDDLRFVDRRWRQ